MTLLVWLNRTFKLLDNSNITGVLLTTKPLLLQHAVILGQDQLISNVAGPPNH